MVDVWFVGNWLLPLIHGMNKLYSNGVRLLP